MNSGKEKEVANSYRDKMRIKAPSIDYLVGGLSGGNQQKVVIAKVLAANPDILIFDEPTRGIDVGARHEIYTLMNELTAVGKSIIMVSSDMEELLGMSERIIVIHEGKFAGEVQKEDFNQETILKKASGL
jgi:ribose transport system ATP-binding protein